MEKERESGYVKIRGPVQTEARLGLNPHSASLPHASPVQSTAPLLAGERDNRRRVSAFPWQQVIPETAKYFLEIENAFESREVNLEERSVICGNAMEETIRKEVELATCWLRSRQERKKEFLNLYSVTLQALHPWKMPMSFKQLRMVVVHVFLKLI
ncbi:hypothetical protein Ancab_011862 [Ancistrocladus abbreviatus]